MRRISFPAAALAAGFAVLLTGCAGETPTTPSSTQPGGPPGGTCTVAIAMLSTSQSPLVGTEVVVRAAVTKAGQAVPDGTSVQFTTDLGVFAENGLQTVSKTTTSGGLADVTLFSVNPGPAHVKASYDCTSSTTTITYVGVPTLGPYVSSFSPQSGTCAGGDTVTISGGLFGNTVGTVFFGGAPGSVVTWSVNTIVVKTPIRSLKNPAVPEIVDLVVVAAAGQTAPVKFTYFCIGVDQRMSIASFSPIAGSPSGGDAVTILGNHFGNNIATTQVTFCGLPAQITGQSDSQMTVSTPAHTLANPALSESCPVTVTRDLGLVSQQSVTALQSFVYRGSGATGTCNTDPTFYVSILTPNTGSPDGGDVVTITGGGFPTNPALLKVEFGGNPATIVGNPTTTVFQVSSPRRVLATPDVPETVDIVVTDLGSANQRCFRVGGAFIYTAKALQPAIYSISPVVGPNDLTTRTTIFGTNFQFPMQVFLIGGLPGCTRVEVSAITVAPTQIVFNMPSAVGAYSCFAGQTVGISVANPATGKTATSPFSFTYYACPNIGNASPSIGSAVATTTVVITGHNFAESVIANFRAGGIFAPLQVTSNSATSIIVTMPPLQTLAGGSLSCSNTDGNIELTFPGLACTPGTILVPFTYRADPPTASSAQPTSLPQDGGSTTITVLGTNFQAPVTVTLIKDGVPVPNTPVNNANVSSPTSLSFTAPAVPNNSLNQQNCSTGGPITGLKYVPTSFGIRLTNTLTKCSVDLPNVLVYNPIDITCRAGLTINTPSLPNGAATVAYGPLAMLAGGGAGAPFTWSATGLPAAMTINPATGVISGIPAAAGTSTVVITVIDAAANSANRLYTLQIN